MKMPKPETIKKIIKKTVEVLLILGEVFPINKNGRKKHEKK